MIYLDDATAAELRAGYEMELPLTPVGEVDKFLADFVDATEFIGLTVFEQTQEKRRGAFDKAATALMNLLEALSGLSDIDNSQLRFLLTVEIESRLPESLRLQWQEIVSSLTKTDALAALGQLDLHARGMAQVAQGGERLEAFAGRMLLRVFRKHHLPWDYAETGYAATCLRVMLRLSGRDDITEQKRIRHWLEKAEQPRSR
ncbi:hypothetical protein [Cupriavidus metallidurans]|uniref:Uncharacterized protein n=1 Tax=Cupriavidus metallidurans (strain ATCC 43123 / DSM 2839 / NBRC 102507 / CH34) TaxID=266264 RepID=Q1LLU4_CUPMC|nr:hypothetical protein [Cupriavidus metallidurans]ABF08882.1 hypothetical protein Rmet_2003 [Cupriavidus metallidurans CH34]QGS30216.1 hypothetical protein FOB83_15705 [Cupriavidus metallidurans]